MSDKTDGPIDGWELGRRELARDLPSMAERCARSPLEPLTTAEVAEIEVRAERATPGPWEHAGGFNNAGCPTLFLKIPGHNRGATVEMMEADVEFIISARTDVPRLLADRWALEEALSTLWAIMEATNGKLREATEEIARTRAPINMIFFCPSCRAQHIDAPEPDRSWTNPPHRSHLCHTCGVVWRPSDVPMNGVATIKTRGELDSSCVFDRHNAYARAQAIISGHSVLCAACGNDPDCPKRKP